MMGHMRTMRGALQRKLKANISLKHPILSWMLIDAGQLLTRLTQGEDGLTPFQRVESKAFEQDLPEVGNSLWSPLQNKAGMREDRGKLMPRCARAVYLGLVPMSTELFLLQPGVLVNAWGGPPSTRIRPMGHGGGEGHHALRFWRH